MPFDCSTLAYQFSGRPSNIYEVNLITGDTTQVASLDIALNAVGYNTLDNYIYGIRIVGGGASKLYRVDSDFSYVQLPNPVGLPLDPFNVGAFDDLGYYYVNSSGSNVFYVIDLGPNRATYGKLVDPTNGYTEITAPPYGITIGNIGATGMSDWAWDSETRQLCGMLNGIGTFRCVDPVTALATDLPTIGAVPAEYGAAISFIPGVFFFPTNNTFQIMRVLISGGNAVVEEFSKTNVSFIDNDATNCLREIFIDFGDAPDTSSGNGTGDYTTLLVNNGPRHGIVNELFLGVTATHENDAYENPTATGDDLIEGIQDDGVITPVNSIILGENKYSVQVSYVNNTGENAVLYGWVDFNQNGIFELEEAIDLKIIPSTGPTPQFMNIEFDVPSGFSLLPGDETFMRLRLTTYDLINRNILPSEEDTRSIGPAADGEVEDYLIRVVTLEINGVVWYDENCNGIREGGELPVEGANVALYNSDTDELVATTTTDVNGAYSFTQIPSGNYYVLIELPNGYQEFTLPNVGGNDSVDSDVNQSTGKSDEFNLSEENPLVTVDAGLCKCFKISGQAFYDCNKNGILDNGEPFIYGVSVILFNDLGVQIDSTFTDCDGYYEFPCLKPGDYTVQFIAPPSMNFSPQVLGQDYGSKPDSITGIATVIITTEDITNIYAGFTGNLGMNMKYCNKCNNSFGSGCPMNNYVKGSSCY
ncbi:SdrD B-like domain-containing protein [Clostridium sp. B9]|uniref:SdrD B-like domain-containing protein n=1 Tax=Clostridium sp. B9 TaxID=3423224 RepID=UPI003D2EC272